ncbi:MAG: hypothetical protein LC648_02650 [Novosphingobium sp.]|nr:hypothetical protein [Novosphingobium sp.]
MISPRAGLAGCSRFIAGSECRFPVAYGGEQARAAPPRASIAHRLSTVADSDRILVLEHGRLAEAGTHFELLRRDGLYAEMWARLEVEKEGLGEAAE